MHNLLCRCPSDSAELAIPVVLWWLVVVIITFVVQGTWSMAHHLLKAVYQDLDREVLQQISWKTKVLAG